MYQSYGGRDSANAGNNEAEVYLMFIANLRHAMFRDDFCENPSRQHQQKPIDPAFQLRKKLMERINNLLIGEVACAPELGDVTIERTSNRIMTVLRRGHDPLTFTIPAKKKSCYGREDFVVLREMCLDALLTDYPAGTGG